MLTRAAGIWLDGFINNSARFRCEIAVTKFPRATFLELQCYSETGLKRSTNMHGFVKRGFLPLVMGAVLLGGCATREAVQQAQAAADAARMQADQATAAANEAVSASRVATQRADQANMAAQQAQQVANTAQNSAQNAAASAQRASDDARSAQQRAQEIQAAQPPAPPPRGTRFARGERG